MKSCTKCLISKELTEFYKRSNRTSVREICKICWKTMTLSRLQKNPRTKEANRISSAKFRAANPTYYHGQYKKTKETNPGALKAQWARKKANRRQAIPKWLTEEQRLQIVQIYANCPKGYHVDHIVPIAGKDVKGLHVPWNLQYLTAKENMRKNNRVIEGNC